MPVYFGPHRHFPKRVPQTWVLYELSHRRGSEGQTGKVLFCRTSQSLHSALVHCDSPRRRGENAAIGPSVRKGKRRKVRLGPERAGVGQGRDRPSGATKPVHRHPLPVQHRKGHLAWLSHFLLVIVRSIVPEKLPPRASSEPPAFSCLKPLLRLLILPQKCSHAPAQRPLARLGMITAKSAP